jgi:hypothetical protein
MQEKLLVLYSSFETSIRRELEMAQINQLQMKFVPAEDRVLFDIKTADLKAYQLWLTRRYMLLLWKVLEQTLGFLEVPVQEIAKGAESVKQKFKKEQSEKRETMSSNYGIDMTQHPLGENPLLVTRISVQKLSESSHNLILHGGGNEQSFKLTVNRAMIQSLQRLMIEVAQRAEWDLPFKI